MNDQHLDPSCRHSPRSPQTAGMRLGLAAACLLLVTTAFAAPAAWAAEPVQLQPPPEAERLASGLATLRLAPGTGATKPAPSDVVRVHYIGYTPEGEIFRQTERSGDPAMFPLDRVFPGWREGIRQMVVGETRRLWIPAHLGPQNPTSGPKASIFDVELVGIDSRAVPPETFAKPPADAKPVGNGAHYRVVTAPAPGAVGPQGQDRVLLNYSVWTADGKMIDSTSTRQRPTAFMLDRVMPAFADVVSQMVVGEKRQVWMPEAVHGRQWPGSPAGPLTFEIEMLRVMDASTLTPVEGDAAVDGTIPSAKLVTPGGSGN